MSWFESIFQKAREFFSGFSRDVDAIESPTQCSYIKGNKAYILQVMAHYEKHGWSEDHYTTVSVFMNLFDLVEEWAMDIEINTHKPNTAQFTLRNLTTEIDGSRINTRLTITT